MKKDDEIDFIIDYPPNIDHEFQYHAFNYLFIFFKNVYRSNTFIGPIIFDSTFNVTYLNNLKLIIFTCKNQLNQCMDIACAYVYSESILMINEILKLFKQHYQREIPCFMTDRDAAYIHSLNNVFPAIPKNVVYLALHGCQEEEEEFIKGIISCH
eukprot:NODE_851_length_3543_cov_0.476771.p3 type:complete len:155 gc:universal NODE_851_length_3543_cov_0.476771:558-94(-)